MNFRYERVAIPRDDLRRFRALLCQLEKDGKEGNHWRREGKHLLVAVRGYAHFIQMVHPDKATSFMPRIDAILKRAGRRHEIRHRPKPKIATPPIPSQESSREKTETRSLLSRLAFWRKRR